MVKRRTNRQDAIRDIVRSKSIRTQRVLVDELQAIGFNCTQATISRDIADMGLRKLSEGFYVLAEDLHLQSQRLGKGGSRLLRACQRGCVDRLDRFVGKPPRQRGGLGQAVIGQPVARVGGVKPVVDVRLGFAVTDQEESHGLIVSG